MPVSLDETDLPPEEQPIPCDRCDGPAQGQLGCGIWERRVCYPCASDWFARSPTHGDIAKKYGSDDDSCRIYFELTTRWVDEFRKAHSRAVAVPPLRAGGAA